MIDVAYGGDFSVTVTPIHQLEVMVLKPPSKLITSCLIALSTALNCVAFLSYENSFRVSVDLCILIYYCKTFGKETKGLYLFESSLLTSSPSFVFSCFLMKDPVFSIDAYIRPVNFGGVSYFLSSLSFTQLSSFGTFPGVLRLFVGDILFLVVSVFLLCFGKSLNVIFYVLANFVGLDVSFLSLLFCSIAFACF